MDFQKCDNCANYANCANYYNSKRGSFCSRRKNGICKFGIDEADVLAIHPFKISLTEYAKSKLWLEMYSGRTVQVFTPNFYDFRAYMRLILPYSLPILIYGKETRTDEDMLCTLSAYNTELRFYTRMGFVNSRPFGYSDKQGITTFHDLYRGGFLAIAAYVNPSARMLKTDGLMPLVVAKEMSDMRNDSIPEAVVA